MLAAPAAGLRFRRSKVGFAPCLQRLNPELKPGECWFAPLEAVDRGLPRGAEMHTPYATPVPARVTWLARSIAAITTSVMFLWVFNVLGGVALSPKVTALGENDTGVIFNWHPLLMVLAFPVLMGEALLAYKAPILYGYASKSR